MIFQIIIITTSNYYYFRKKSRVVNILYKSSETDLYHFWCDRSRWRNRRWFTAKGGRRRSRADAGRRRRMTLDSLPPAFGISFLLDGAAVLRALQQFQDSLFRTEILGRVHANQLKIVPI